MQRKELAKEQAEQDVFDVVPVLHCILSLGGDCLQEILSLCCFCSFPVYPDTPVRSSGLSADHSVGSPVEAAKSLSLLVP